MVNVAAKTRAPRVLVLLAITLFYSVSAQITQEGCYDSYGKAQRCLPKIANIALNIPVEATNTCGTNGVTEFCPLSLLSSKSCQTCYDSAQYPGSSYPPSHLTDLHAQHNQTWWQSETMLEGIQYPSQVNLTINLMKAYDITFIQLLFHSPRPESLAIYKKTTQDGPWTPYQFFSRSCQETYGLAESKEATDQDETKPLCRADFSTMQPLTHGLVSFGTLEGRPNLDQFSTSAALQEWVSATGIQFTLDRLNTLGDESSGSPMVLKSYFYAVTDIIIGGRCRCNGHASDCPLVGPGWKKVCRCEHNTDGEDCEKCLPFYNDAPWQRATETDAHECKACDCNGFSNRCFFDEKLYKETGHGGHCLDCQGNRTGPNCERCQDNFYEIDESGCKDCGCDEVGSLSMQCDSEGKCQCKPGVGGDKCDH